MKRECVDCEWCKSLEDSEGNLIYFCMDRRWRKLFGGETSSGYCEVEDED